MKLQTKVNIPSSPFKINPTQKGLVIGSCFAENIGNYLINAGFDVTCNPQGILYNPLSILEGLRQLKKPKPILRENLVFHNELYHSMAHHGSFSDTDPNAVLEKVNAPQPHEFDYIIITLGSSFVYKIGEQVVANCHKLPKDTFSHTRLLFNDIRQALDSIVSLFPEAKILFTVSPIRHLSDTLINNSASKALLRAAVAETLDCHKNCAYFPSFEIMNDELRDYRFYAADMLHPTAQAVEYIIEEFSLCYFAESTQMFIGEIKRYFALKNHRTLNANTLAHQKHIQKIDSIRAELLAKYPFLAHHL